MEKKYVIIHYDELTDHFEVAFADLIGCRQATRVMIPNNFNRVWKSAEGALIRGQEVGFKAQHNEHYVFFRITPRKRFEEVWQPKLKELGFLSDEDIAKYSVII